MSEDSAESHQTVLQQGGGGSEVRVWD